MQYIQSNVLDKLNADLTIMETSDSRIDGRAEVYSCITNYCGRFITLGKSIGHGRKLFKQLNIQHQEGVQAQQLAQEQRNSYMAKITPSFSASSVSPDYNPGFSMDHASGPFGSMTEQQGRKRLFYLISTLNAAYPDYDFSSVKPDHFTKHNFQFMMKSIKSNLQNVGHDQFATSMITKIWNALSELIGPTSKQMISDSNVDPPEVVNTISDPTEQKNESKMPVSNSRTSAIHRNDQKIESKPKKQKNELEVVTSSRKSSISSSFPTADEWNNVVEFYSYQPDDATGAGDPYDDDDIGTLWTFHYFFYNRKFKRILYLTLRGASLDSSSMRDDEQSVWDSPIDYTQPIPSEPFLHQNLFGNIELTSRKRTGDELDNTRIRKLSLDQMIP